jgi:non-ribosomal peptide synthetase component F
MVEAIRPARSLSYTPLFQAMFSWESAAAGWDLPQVTVTPIEKDHMVAKFDLTLSMAAHGHGLRAAFEYSTDLFDRATVEVWSEHFRTLLAALADDPGSRVKPA